jgi:26S proteasome regulatory subunit N13
MFRYLLQFNNGNKRHFFWMQEPKADKDEETIKKFNDYMNNPPEEASEAGAAGDSGGLNNQMLMQMLGGMQQTRRGQAAASAGGAGAAAAAAAPRPAAPSATNPPAATTSTSAAAPAAAVPGAPAASAQGGDVMRQQLSNLLSGMMPGLAQREDQAGLTDVLATDQLLQTGILSDPAVRAELEQHLPSIDQAGDLATTLRSPQFRQAVESFNAALASGALPELLASLGLPPSSEASASNLEAFLKAVQQKANKDAEKK